MKILLASAQIFSYLICELNIYCGKTNQHCSDESDFVYVEIEQFESVMIS